MAWTYDATDLDNDTSSGRLNVVRFLIGDTDTTDQQLQDEEISYLLSEAQDNPKLASAKAARNLSAKYSRLVTTELDGQLTMEYGELSSRYNTLADTLEREASSSGAAFKVITGELSKGRITKDGFLNKPRCEY